MRDIAVVVPTYRRPELLRRALASVERTAAGSGLLSRFEIVIVDDDFGGGGPLPEMPGLECRLLRHPRGPRQGPAACRNLGVASTRAEYIFFLDDDDEFLSGRFDRSLVLLESGRADAVFERVIRERLGPAGEVEVFETGPSDSSAVDPFEFLLTQREEGHVSTSATSFTRTSFDLVGGMNEALRFGEDGELMLRLALRCRVAMLGGAPVARMHRHDANVSRADRIHYWHPISALRELHGSTDWRGNSEREALVRRVLAGKIDYALSRCRMEYDYLRRLREGIQVLRHAPLHLLTAQNLRSILVWLLWPRPSSSPRYGLR